MKSVWILAILLFSLHKTFADQECLYQLCLECPETLNVIKEVKVSCAESNQVSAQWYHDPLNYTQTINKETENGCVMYKAHKKVTDENGDSTDYFKGCVPLEQLNQICKDLEKEALKRGKVVDYCHICKEGSCNNALKIQASLLILLSTVISKLISS